MRSWGSIVLLIVLLLASLALTLAAGGAGFQGSDDRAREMASNLTPTGPHGESGTERGPILPERVGFALQYLVGATGLALALRGLALQARGRARRHD